jgi:hypothetical protein
MRGNQAATIVGQHGAAWRREHEAEIRTMADRLVRDAGYLSLDSAPLSLQIVAIAVARTTKVADTAYWRMMEIGGPVADSGKERRAYRVWADSNSDLARDLKGVMSEMVAAQPPKGEGQRNQFEDLTTDELIALTVSLGLELRELKKRTDAARQSRSQFTDSKCDVPPVLPARAPRPNSDPAFSRESPATSTAPLPRSVTLAAAPSPEYPSKSVTSPAHSPAAPEGTGAEPANGSRPSSVSPEPITIHDDPYARFRNV